MSVIKKILRSQAITNRKNYDIDFINAESRKIHSMLFECDIWKKARVVGVTRSLSNEIDTIDIIKEGFKDNKIMVAPKTLFPERSMDFIEVKDFADFRKTSKGLYEPYAKNQLYDQNDIDLLLVPGLLFDNAGYRIGFGGGFYDRYLKYYKNATIGMCFSWEKVEELPYDHFDERVQYIITQNGIVKTEAKNNK